MRSNFPVFSPSVLTLALAAALPVTGLAETELPQTVVTASRQAQRVSEVLADVTVIERAQIESIGQGTVVDLLSRQPGIQTVQLGGAGGTTDFFLRGARSEHTKVLVDGIPINTMDTKGSPLRTLALADVERIEILRGPSSALYGSDAMGGVIQIFTRKAGDGVHGEIFGGYGSRNTSASSANLSAGGEMWSARGGVSYYKTGGFSSLANGRNLDQDRDGYSNHSGNVALSFRPAPGHELSLTSMVTGGTLQSDSASTNAKSNTFDNHTDFHNEVLGISSRNRWTDTWTSTLRYGINIQDDTSYSRSSSGVVSTNNLRTENHTASWQNDVVLPLGTGLLMFERQTQSAGPTTRFPQYGDVSINAFQMGWTGALNGHHWQISGRHDDHSSFGTANTGSAAYGYDFAPGWRAHVSTATSFRAPTMYQLYAQIAGQLNPNPDLQPEHGRNFEIALSHDWGDHSLTLTGFHNRISNLIDFNSTTLKYQNLNSATLEGWNLAYQGKWQDWQLGADLDLLNAYDNSTGLALRRRAKEKLGFTADRQWQDWAFGVQVIAMGHRYDTDDQKLPEGGYTLLNLTARYALTKDLKVEMRADNVTERKYVSAYSSGGTFVYNVPGATYFLGLRYAL